MSSTLPLISICVPVYNEELNIEPFHRRVISVIDGLADRYRFEILFTDNHSTDTTFERASGPQSPRSPHPCHSLFPELWLPAIDSDQLHECAGEAAIQLDVDLQDPPELIVDFLLTGRKGTRSSTASAANGPMRAFGCMDCGRHTTASSTT